MNLAFEKDGDAAYRQLSIRGAEASLMHSNIELRKYKIRTI